MELLQSCIKLAISSLNVLSSPAACTFPAAWSANVWFYEMKAPVTNDYYYILDYSNHFLRETPVQATAQGAAAIDLLRQTCKHA